MDSGFFTLAYLVAGGLFILSLGGLSQQRTASRGNWAGIAGMVIAVGATALHPDAGAWSWILLALLLGGALGGWMARRVRMTQMPQLVAALHSFVGLAAVFVGLSTFLHPGEPMEGGAGLLHTLEVFADVVIGAVTFAGSVVAWGKLDGRISGAPLLLPGRHRLNAIVFTLLLALALPVALLGSGFFFLCVAALLACFLGAHLVLAIGGADMPVVVSLLNSYSGWTAAAAGFMLSNNLLIITGALVGSSGAILSYIMCEAMNRSVWNVVFGGFGTEASASPDQPAPAGDVRAIDAEGVRDLVRRADEILVIPGYGLAVARAQNAVHEFVREAETSGARVRFAIHPVAGRLPGHMNVLLAEAGVPYDLVHEMDDINEEIAQVDLVLVIGANDIVNPGAQTDATSPIYGMPVLEAWKAKDCIVLKRSMNVGYAGVANPLFFHERSHMLFGDARERMEELVGLLRG